MSPTPRIPADDDRVHGRTLAALAVVAALVLAACLAVVAAMLPRAARTDPPRVAARRLGFVDQTLVEEDDHARAQRARLRRELEVLGWVDRPNGVARIPIGRAIDLLVAREASR